MKAPLTPVPLMAITTGSLALEVMVTVPLRGPGAPGVNANVNVQ